MNEFSEWCRLFWLSEIAAYNRMHIYWMCIIVDSVQPMSYSERSFVTSYAANHFGIRGDSMFPWFERHEKLVKLEPVPSKT